MNLLQATKKVLAIAPISKTNGSTVTGNIDTLGHDYVSIDVTIGAADVVSNKPSVLKISESDDTVVTNFADITALVGGGTGGFTIPSADTTNPMIYTFDVDTRIRKRYLKVSVSPQTTQIVGCLAQLSRSEQAPVSTTARGNNLIVIA